MLSSRSEILDKVINKRWDSGGLKYDSLLKPIPLTHRQSKLPQITKINKIMLAAFPSSIVYKIRIQNQISILS